MLELRPLVLEGVQVESEDVELLGREGRKIRVKVGGVSEGGKCFEEKETKRKGKGKLKG